MKKFYLLLSAVLLAVLTATAQTSTISWGYCGKNVSGAFGETLTPKGAIYIPEDIAQMYVGAEVTGVRVGLSNSASDVNIFVSEDLNATPTLQETKTGSYPNGFTNLSFTNGTYTITGKGFYVGYSCTGLEAAPLGISETYNANGCYADLGDGWKNYSADENYQSLALCIAARIKGSNMPKDLSLVAVNSVTQKKNTPFTISGTVMSLSPKLIKNFTLAYSIDGGEEQTFVVTKNIGAGVAAKFEVEHPGLADGGTHSLDCRIVKVGDEADPYDGNNHASSFVGIVTRFPKYRMVAEEGTGTWCGYCPRGIYGFKKMQEKYPDNFVGIAIHPALNSEPWALQCPTYNGLTFNAFPTAYINRNPRMLITPSPSYLESAYLSTMEDMRLGEVEITSRFTDNSKKAIEATAVTTFVTDLPETNYRIAFVLTEDNVSGYKQANNFTGGDASEVGEWSTMGTYPSVDMQHVAREIYGYRGIENSIPKSVKGETPVYFTQTLELNDRVKNPDNLNVIALLFNTRTGLIENAAEARVGQASATVGINDISDDSAFNLYVSDGKIACGGFDGKLSVYTVDGKQVANESLKCGIYIVKGYNGKASFVKRIAL